MPKKKEETEEVKDETMQEETTETEAVKADDSETDVTKAKKKTVKANKADDEVDTDNEGRVDEETENVEDSSILGAIAGTISDVVGTVGDTASTVIDTITEAVGLKGDEESKKSDRGNRAERIGIVASDKMEKTVSVRVDRLVKHPMYRKYVRKKKKFLAHDEIGAAVGDKVRIVETRPLSARKRWRVVEIIRKAER